MINACRGVKVECAFRVVKPARIRNGESVQGPSSDNRSNLAGPSGNPGGNDSPVEADGVFLLGIEG